MTETVLHKSVQVPVLVLEKVGGEDELQPGAKLLPLGAISVVDAGNDDPLAEVRRTRWPTGGGEEGPRRHGLGFAFKSR